MHAIFTCSLPRFSIDLAVAFSQSPARSIARAPRIRRAIPIAPGPRGAKRMRKFVQKRGHTVTAHQARAAVHVVHSVWVGGVCVCACFRGEGCTRRQKGWTWKALELGSIADPIIGQFRIPFEVFGNFVTLIQSITSYTSKNRFNPIPG
jgi:hypothetical protein